MKELLYLEQAMLAFYNKDLLIIKYTHQTGPKDIILFKKTKQKEHPLQENALQTPYLKTNKHLTFRTPFHHLSDSLPL